MNANTSTTRTVIVDNVIDVKKELEQICRVEKFPPLFVNRKRPQTFLVSDLLLNERERALLTFLGVKKISWHDVGDWDECIFKGKNINITVSNEKYLSSLKE